MKRLTVLTGLLVFVGLVFAGHEGVFSKRSGGKQLPDYAGAKFYNCLGHSYFREQGFALCKTYEVYSGNFFDPGHDIVRVFEYDDGPFYADWFSKGFTRGYVRKNDVWILEHEEVY